MPIFNQSDLKSLYNILHSFGGSDKILDFIKETEFKHFKNIYLDFDGIEISSSNFNLIYSGFVGGKRIKQVYLEVPFVYLYDLNGFLDSLSKN